MQEDRISRFFDLNNIKAESEAVLEYLNKVLKLVQEINTIKMDVDKAGSFKILADNIDKVKRAVDETKAATDKLGEASAAAAKKQVDAYAQLKGQYRDAIRNAQNLAAQFGAQSDQAIKAAQAADVYRQRLQQIKDLLSSGGQKATVFDPNSVPFENKTGTGGEAARVQDYRSTEAAIDEMRAHVDTLTEAYERLSVAEKEGAAGQSLLAEINSLNAAYDDAVLHSQGLTKAVEESGAAIKQSALPVDDVKLKYDDYTGTLQENIALQQKYIQQLQENKAAQQAISGTTDEEIARLNQLKQQELELTNASRELSTTIKNQTKEWTAAEGSIDQMQAQLALLKQSYEGLSAAEKESAFGQGMLTEVQALDAAVKASEKQIGNAQRNVGNYASAFTGAGQKIVNFVTRDLFRAIAGFVVFQLLFETLSSLGEKLAKVFADVINPVNELVKKQQALQEVNVKAADSVGEVTVKVAELKEKIALAKEGILDKDKVLKDYNDSLGKTAGFTSDLNKAEKTLLEHGKEIIELTLLKGKAQAAAALATEQIKKATEDSAKGAADFVDNWDAVGDILKNSLNYLNPFKNDAENLAKMGEDLAKTGEKNKQKEIKDAEDKYKKFMDLEKDFLEKAAKYAHDHRLSFYDEKQTNPKDFAPELFKQQEAVRKAKFDAQQKELEDKVKYDDDIVKDDKRSFNERLDATQAFYNNSLKMLENARDFQLGEVDNQDAEAKRKINRELQNTKLTAQQRKVLQDTLKAIDEAGAAKREKIQEDFNFKVYDLNDKSEKQITSLIEDNNKKRADYAKDQAQKMYNAVADQVQASQDGAEKAEAVLDKLYAQGKLTKKQYEDEKYDIEEQLRTKSLQKWIDYYKEILSFVYLDKDAREKALKELDNLEKQLHDEHKKKDKKDAEDEREDFDLKKQRLQQLGDALKTTAFSFLGSAIEQQKNAVQDQINALDQLTQKEIDAVNQSVASQQDKAARIAIIEARAQSQKEALQARQKQLDEQKARFDRLSSMAGVVESTARAVTSDLKDHKELVPYDIAIGAAQLAAILAQPIPRYAKGTKDHPGGLALVGDGGRSELVVTPGGDLFRTPSKSTLVDLPEHSVVLPQLPSAETLAMWATKGAVGAIGAGRRDNGTLQLSRDLHLLRRDMVEAVKNIPQPFFRIDGEITKWVRSKDSWFRNLKH